MLVLLPIRFTGNTMLWEFILGVFEDRVQLGICIIEVCSGSQGCFQYVRLQVSLEVDPVIQGRFPLIDTILDQRLKISNKFRLSASFKLFSCNAEADNLMVKAKLVQTRWRIEDFDIPEIKTEVKK